MLWNQKYVCCVLQAHLLVFHHSSKLKGQIYLKLILNKSSTHRRLHFSVLFALHLFNLISQSDAQNMLDSITSQKRAIFWPLLTSYFMFWGFATSCSVTKCSWNVGWVDSCTVLAGNLFEVSQMALALFCVNNTCVMCSLHIRNSRPSHIARYSLCIWTFMCVFVTSSGYSFVIFGEVSLCITVCFQKTTECPEVSEWSGWRRRW